MVKEEKEELELEEDDDNEESKPTLEQLFSFTFLSKQILLKEIAYAHSLYDGRSYEHIYKIFFILLSRIGEEKLRKKWGQDFDRKMQIIKDLHSPITGVSVFLSLHGIKKMRVESDISSPSFRNYIFNMKKIMENVDVLLDGYFELLFTPQCNNLSVPNEMWVTLDQQLGVIIRPRIDRYGSDNQTPE